jgi:hypothetical protein
MSKVLMISSNTFSIHTLFLSPWNGGGIWGLSGRGHSVCSLTIRCMKFLMINKAGIKEFSPEFIGLSNVTLMRLIPWLVI